MSLLAKIQADLVKAQKEKDQKRISILRFLLAKIHDAQITKGKDKPLTEEEILKEISAEVKRHQESIEFAKKAGRTELAEIEKKELEILQKYLPEQLTGDEISKIVEEAISQTGAKSLADFGKAMAGVMPKVAGRAEGSTVAEIVKKRLAPSA